MSKIGERQERRILRHLPEPFNIYYKKKTKFRVETASGLNKKAPVELSMLDGGPEGNTQHYRQIAGVLKGGRG